MGTNTYVVFKVADTPCALAREHVRRILPIPALGRPPGLPSTVEGVLNLAGTAVPVLRLDRLFGLPPVSLHAYQHLILLCDNELPLALLVDQAMGVRNVPADRLMSLHPSETFNGCVVGHIAMDDVSIHLLSAERLLDKRERHALAEFQLVQRRRLDEMRGSP
jgi:purine-binding chemotaxis protein CheW